MMPESRPPDDWDKFSAWLRDRKREWDQRPRKAKKAEAGEAVRAPQTKDKKDNGCLACLGKACACSCLGLAVVAGLGCGTLTFVGTKLAEWAAR